MKSKHQKLRIALALAAMALTTHASCADATITYVGNVEGAEVTDWRTTTTTKTLDIDGDNQYGTYSGYHWQIAGVNAQVPSSTTPGTAYISSGPQFINPDFTDIDHITSFPTDADAGIALSAFTFELTGTASTYVGQTVRVGMMQDVLGASEWAADQFKGLQINQTVGGSATSGSPVSVRSGAAGNGVPEMYFFDLTDVTAGDQFTILVYTDVGGTTSQAGYLGPVSFDIIPEPSSALLGGLGLLALFRRRRS